jgi:ubiquinone/menaquinone biosynthesis C-methylase UbiE
MSAKQETQYESAQRMYTERAPTYEDSWHPGYTERFMAFADVRKGDRVLDLACGTGLDAIMAARQVGDEGIVVGVDATPAMLAEAQKKLDADAEVARRLTLVQHNATDLGGCALVDRASFDWIICSSAFVLFEQPAKVVAHWTEYLRPGGRMLIDITHEHNLRAGLVMEDVAARLGVPYPTNRRWIRSADSFRDILEEQGHEVERVALVEKVVGKGSEFLDVSAAEAQFHAIINSPIVANIDWDDELRAKALSVFKEEWEAAAVGGQVEISDSVYVYVTRKK